MLRNMSPSLTQYDTRHRSGSNAEISSHGRLSLSGSDSMAYCDDRGVRKSVRAKVGPMPQSACQPLRTSAGVMSIAARRDLPAFSVSIVAVVCVCAEPQVRRIAARRVVAGVEHEQPFGNVPVGSDPRDAVREPLSSHRSELRAPVVLRGAAHRPLPASPEFGPMGRDRSIAVDLAPKAGEGGIVKFSHVEPPQKVPGLEPSGCDQHLDGSSYSTTGGN